MIEHQVDDYPGYAYVEPDRKGPSGNFSVLVKAATERAVKSDDSKDGHRHGKNRVSKKDCPVDVPHPARTRKFHAADVVVVNQIAGQEDNRYPRTR